MFTNAPEVATVGEGGGSGLSERRIDGAARLTSHNAGRGAAHCRVSIPLVCEAVQSRHSSSLGCCLAGGRSGPSHSAVSSVATSVDPVIQLETVDIPGGCATVGTDKPLLPLDGEGPSETVWIKPFRFAQTAVTVDEFAAFVLATGYVTEAERIGWSFVFKDFVDGAGIRSGHASAAPWWVAINGASWKAPRGGALGQACGDHPVVHVSWRDASAFAGWAGGRLPTEAEWEWAAQGGLGPVAYPWGDREPDDLDFFPCNIWQGAFPATNTELDGHDGTAPALSFAPNGYGLYNMAGNVWEWCSDAFRVRSLSKAARQRNAQARRSGERTIKGGSYLCHASYCHRYRIAARSGSPPDSATGHLGFRLAFDRP